MSEPWPTLLAFGVSVVLLYLTQRWINQHMQGVGILLFGSQNAGTVLLWLFLLPGVFIHELGHWLMAKVLGLKTGRFRIWPQPQGQQIILGSVEVQHTNALLDSLVGLAPFLGGTTALLFIGYRAFDAAALGVAWEMQDWPRLVELLSDSLYVPDAWLWLYLMVAISNAMMPSPTDRSSWRSLLIYLALVSAVVIFFFGLPSLPDSLIQQITDLALTLLYAFGLTLVVDLIFVLVLAIIEFIIGSLRRRKIVYK